MEGNTFYAGLYQPTEGLQGEGVRGKPEDDLSCIVMPPAGELVEKLERQLTADCADCATQALPAANRVMPWVEIGRIGIPRAAALLLERAGCSHPRPSLELRTPDPSETGVVELPKLDNQA